MQEATISAEHAHARAAPGAVDTHHLGLHVLISYQQFAIQQVSRLLHEQEHTAAGQQIRSKIDSFQNANFLISQPKPYGVTTHWNRLGETISMRVTS